MRPITVGLALLAVLMADGAGADDAKQLPPCRLAGITPPVALGPHVPPPETYPPLSVMLGETGNTTLGYVVKADGTVGGATVSRSSGSLRLDDAAIAFVQGFKFKPAVMGGAPTACTQQIRVAWMLGGSGEMDLSMLGGVVLHPGAGDLPSGAAALHEEGTVVALVALDDKGAIDLVVPVSPTGFADLNAASLELVRKQKFAAATVNGA
ncbi:MAG TPA: TonB family protein, partial [Rhizomicrobium sp.]